MGKSDYPKVLRRGVAVMVILLLLLFGAFAPAAMAADDWPDCSWTCHAADFNVIRVWLGDSSGNEFDPGSCSPGDLVIAYIWARIEVTANSDRYAGFVHYNLTINNVPGSLVHSCFADTVSVGPHNYRILGPRTWTCGDKVVIGGPGPGLVVSGEANSNICPGDGMCSERTAKCYKGGDIIVVTPLVANFESTTVCYGTNTQFTDKTTGGVKEYYYSWDFNNNGTYEIVDSLTAANPSHHYDNPGTHTAKLRVNDSDSPVINTDSQTHIVTVYQNPTANAGDNKSISVGDSVVIGGSPTASGGAPSYTYSWTPTTGLNVSTIANPRASPTSTTIYTVTVTDDNGCVDSDSMTVYFSDIQVVKTASLTGTCPGSDPLAVGIGDTVTYCYNVTNTGDVTLTGIVLVDSILGTVSLGGTTSLAPNAWATGTKTHLVDENDIPSVTNWGNVSSKDPLGSWVNESDTCIINVGINPSIDIVKTASTDGSCPGVDPLAVSIGDTVTYCYNVTNTGDVTLTGIVLVDSILGTVSLGGTTSLAPNAWATGTKTHLVDENDIPSVTNWGNVSSKDPLGSWVNESDTCIINVGINPSIDIVKTASTDGSCPGVDPLAVSIGDTVTYCYNVTNTGDVTLTGIVLVDSILGTVSLGGTTSLAPNAWATGTKTHLVDENDIPSVTNWGNVSSKDPLGSWVNESDTCIINVGINPSIDIVKTASTDGSCPGVDPLAVSIGDTVTYCYNVTNTGDVTLTGIVLVDSILGTVSLGGTTSLAPNAWATGTKTHLVDENDIPSVTNWGNVSSKDPLGSWVNESDTCIINVGINLTMSNYYQF